jgi:hypothetical protein
VVATLIIIIFIFLIFFFSFLFIVLFFFYIITFLCELLLTYYLHPAQLSLAATARQSPL